jgi:hypothetical protein
VRQIFTGQTPFDFLLHVGEISDEYQLGTLRDLVKVWKENKRLSNDRSLAFFTHDKLLFVNLKKE